MLQVFLQFGVTECQKSFSTSMHLFLGGKRNGFTYVKPLSKIFGVIAVPAATELATLKVFSLLPIFFVPFYSAAGKPSAVK